MKRILPIAALAGLFALASAPVTAWAADGAVCYSAELTVNASPGSTTSFPLISNTTTFTCHDATPYTLRQLTYAFWKIIQVSTVTVSTTVNPNGTTTTKFRHMVIVQQ